MINKTPLFLVTISCLAVIYLLFSVKNGVMSMRLELSELQKQINQETETLKILKAEFSYLTAPVRLEKLNNQYLKLRQSVVAQLVNDPLYINDNLTVKSKIFAKKEPAQVTNWRYKKSQSKYLTLVAKKR